MGTRSILITPKNKEEEKFLRSLFKRMGLSGSVFSEKELEDAGLALAMSKADTTKVADYDHVMRLLRSENENPC